MSVRVILFAGSPADRAHVGAIEKALDEFGIAWVRRGLYNTVIRRLLAGADAQAILDEFGIAHASRIASAHKTPRRLLDIIAEYDADGIPTVYIAAAGRSNALSGLLDAATSAPVITCPPPSEQWSPYDIWSSLRMPSGVAPALVLDPGNAALCAAKLLALSEPSLKERIRRFQEKNAARLVGEDEELMR